MRKGWVCLLAAVMLVSGGFVLCQKWQQVAVLVIDASRDETRIEVDSGDQIVVDKTIMLESRDGKVKQTYEVRHVYGETVILQQRLQNEFLAGSRIYQ